MSEHAFDPIPDEEQEVTAVSTPAANAVVTAAQLAEAIETGRWSHDVPGTALWLNTSFLPGGRDPSTVAEDLAAHGIAVV
jgi:hypothetical protein